MKLKTAKHRKKTRKTYKKQRTYRGGNMTSIQSKPIQSKPIVFAFFHGGNQIANMSGNPIACNAEGLYRLGKNVQYLHAAQSGELITTEHKPIIEFLKDPNIRKKTFEPMFDLHSMSDLEGIALYKDYSPIQKLNKKGKPMKVVSEIPFTGAGVGIFEGGARAKEDSVIPNSILSVKTDQEKKVMGLYVYYPDEYKRPAEFIDIDTIYNTLGLTKYFFKLSDVFNYIEKTGIYTHDRGIGFIQVSCRGFYAANNNKKISLYPKFILQSKALQEACWKVSEIVHKANNEYMSLDLLDSEELAKKYELPIIMPVFLGLKASPKTNMGELLLPAATGKWEKIVQSSNKMILDE